jgi:hypothetical protein
VRAIILASQIRILSLSDDGSVRRTREILLKSAGYEVVSLPGDAELTNAAACSNIAVLCHSFLASDVVQLAHELRECNPAIRVLEIIAYNHRQAGIADAECCMYDGPSAFLDSVASLVSGIDSTRKFR